MRCFLYRVTKHKYNDAMNMRFKKSQSGYADKRMVVTVSLSITSAVFLGLFIWALISYLGQKSDVDTRIANAVSVAEKNQADADEIKFAKIEKEPNREFVGPDDYGRVTFKYPKTWSVYIDKDVTNGGTFSAYLNPVTVPPVSNSQQFALRVTIEEKDYDKVIASYDSAVKKGDLRSSSVTANGVNGTRLDGSFSKDIRGSAAIFKIRDKTLTIRSDADTFKPDFDKLVATVKFNQ